MAERDTLAELDVLIEPRFQKFENRLRDVERRFAAASRQIEAQSGRVGAAVSRSFESMGARASASFARMGAAMAGAFAVGSITHALIRATNLAADLNETQSKTQEVFGASADAVRGMADELSKRFGVVRKETLDAASAFGLILQGMRVAEGESARLSMRLARLAADAASFYNVPVDVALEKIRAGLSGEAEPLRAFGVMLSEANVQAKALAMGLVQGKGDLDDYAKALARVELIAEGLRKAEGDLERTSDSLSNRQRKLAGDFIELQTRLGEELAPAMRGAINLTYELGSALTGMVGDAESRVAALAGAVKGLVDQLRLAVTGTAGGFFGGFEEGMLTVLDKLLMGSSKNVQAWIRSIQAERMRAIAEMDRAFAAAAGKFAGGGGGGGGGGRAGAGGGGGADAGGGAGFAAADQAATAFDTVFQRLVEQAGVLTFGADAWEDLTLKLHGATEAQMQQIAAMREQIAASERAAAKDAELARNREEHSRAIQAAQDEMERAAGAIFDQTRTPFEKFQGKLAELRDMVAKGFLNEDTFNRAAAQVRGEFESASAGGMMQRAVPQFLGALELARKISAGGLATAGGRGQNAGLEQLQSKTLTQVTRLVILQEQMIQRMRDGRVAFLEP